MAEMTRLRLGRRGAAGLVMSLVTTGFARPADADTLFTRSVGAATMSIGDLYGAVTAEGLQLSNAGRALVGRFITLKGYMAPPLKAESDFFVLTRYPMSTCPFCSNAADWPADIVVVNLGRSAEMLEAAYAIQVSGILDVGAKMDMTTGFVSLVRVVDATWRRL